MIYKGIHHRNPSGRHNKIHWLLSEAQWNLKRLHKVYAVVCKENDSINWSVAYALAMCRIRENIQTTQNLIKDIKTWQNKHKDCPNYISDALSSVIDYMREEDE